MVNFAHVPLAIIATIIPLANAFDCMPSIYCSSYLEYDPDPNINTTIRA
ncbi:hypothetical protein TPAR_08414, partial [Tolypocladium paradoxum]